MMLNIASADFHIRSAPAWRAEKPRRMIPATPSTSKHDQRRHAERRQRVRIGQRLFQALGARRTEPHQQRDGAAFRSGQYSARGSAREENVRQRKQLFRRVCASGDRARNGSQACPIVEKSTIRYAASELGFPNVAKRSSPLSRQSDFAVEFVRHAFEAGLEHLARCGKSMTPANRGEGFDTAIAMITADKNRAQPRFLAPVK